MNFIDTTGHVFSLPSYDDIPLHLKYKEGDYVFWLKDQEISINNYYILPIRMIVNVNDVIFEYNGETIQDPLKLDITIDSNFYKLLGPKYIQEKLEQNNSIKESIEIDFDEAKSALSIDDFYFDKVNNYNNLIVESGTEKYYLFPFYVIGKCDIEGTILSNIMIKMSTKTELNNNEEKTLKDKDQYTQITIGGTFIDEQEELIINGRNMGIQLPKEIIKSIYESSFYHKYSNEKLLKDKMKELLLNYMSIKGECGNFKSIYNSLKWFGWGGKLEISKLIKTDNEFQNQFILDYFSITTDIKDVYRFFNPTNMISLSVKGNEEDHLDIQDHNNSFIGEGKPIMKDLFDEVVEVKDQGISFYKPYYDFVFTELALKLDCLKYYYQRYFLPIHIKINRASIDYKVYANTVKMTAMGFEKQTEAPVYIPNKNLKVIFPEEKELLYYRSEHYIDSMFNEFNIYNERYNNDNNDLFYVNENCIVIPLIFRDLNNLYTKSDKGEYLLINGEYIKPYAFTTIDGEECDPEYAKRYVLYPGYEAKEFINIERYTKISEGYFDCRIYVTYTVKEQADNGHYVYKDGEYLYKEKFYNDFGGEDENGNYTYFWGNKETRNSLEYVPSKNRYKIVTKNLLDRDNNFVFYQDGYTYYRNLILIPRLLNTKDIDWLNTDFRISVLLNNTWFTYDFRVKIPDLYLEFGRLKYRYFVQNNFTMFNQVDKITDNDIKFNVFMYQPDLITINSLFMKENSDTEIQTFLDKICSLEYIESEYGDYLFSEDIQGNWQFYKPFKFVNENNEETDLIHATHYIPTENHVPVSLKGERRFNKRDINEEMYEFYNKYYRKKIQVPYNKNYYNQIHLFNIYTYTNEQIEYDDNPKNIDLYRTFFNDNGTLKFNIKENIPYDFYLMHDKFIENKKAYWYGVFISKYPIGNYNEEDLKIQNPFYDIDGNYELKYDGTSIEKFLVNRMDIEKANGYNHFNQNDLIIVGVKNNDYHFNIDLTNKWTINPISDFNNINVVRGNSNILIIPNNNYSHLYSPGYYNVLLNYSINGLADHNYLTKGHYRVNYEVEDIEYPELIEIEPEVKKYDVRDTISDFTILYEDVNGNWIKTTEVIDPSLGYHPIGIKIMNKHYFGREQDWDIYIALKFLSVNNPDTGWQGLGTQNKDDVPYFGFYGINIPTLNDYPFICYKDNNHTQSVEYIYPQTDSMKDIPTNEDGTPKYPAPNGRGWHFNPESSQGKIYNINLLNDDDTFNTNMITDLCAISNWNGWENTQKIIEAFSSEYDGWQTSGTINNIYDKEFSPVCACAWRYHTISTRQGDWYIPSYAEVFFLSYNFQRLKDLFNEIATLYPDDCKIDMISSIDALWTSTEYDKDEMWEIHPGEHAHKLSKLTKWISFPYLRVGENGVYRSSNNSQNNEEELWYIESSQNYGLNLIINLENNLIASIFYFCMINPGMFCILTINKNEFKIEQINMYTKNIEQTEIYNTNEILPTKPTIGNYIFNENNELKLIIGTTNFNGLVCYLYPNKYNKDREFGNINNYDLELGVGNDENINPLLRYHCQFNDNIFSTWS